MKIGITCYPIYGGSGVVATELGKALAARGHEVHFISYQMPFRLGHISENVFFHEVSTTSYPVFEHRPYTLTLTSKMVDVAKHHGLDILHVHYAIPHATSAVLARQILQKKGLCVPVVTTLHGTDITLVGQDPSFAPVVAHSIEESDGVTAVSEYLRTETYEHFDVTTPIEVIPNFVDIERFRRQNKDHFRTALFPNGEKILAHVSNFRPVKRAGDTVRILARLRELGEPVKLLLIGDGPDRAPTEALARELGVHDDVRFLGKQDPIEELLSIADVFLLPSGSETFGLAALEAMACGVPVVSSDIGGLPEVIVDGESGYLCPLGDVEAMSQGVRRLISDDTLHAQMVAGAEARAEHFRIERVVPLYEAHYRSVIEARMAAPCS